MKRFVSIMLAAVLLCMFALPGVAMAQTETKAVTLAKVKKLQATQATSEGKLTLKWNKVKGAAGYEIYRQGPDDTDFVLVQSVTKNKVTIKGHAAGGVKYIYRVRAYAADGVETVYGDFSNDLTVKFVDAPTSLRLVKGKSGSGEVTLKYAAPEGCYRCQIYMKEPGSTTYKWVTSLKGSVQKYLMEDLTSGQTYYFKVRAYWRIGGRNFYTDYTNAKSVLVP